MRDKYNGLTNYATWRVNLEIFDGIDPTEMDWHKLDKYDLAATLKEYAHELIEMDAREGLALDYARAFMSGVDWYDIGRSMRDAYELDADTSEDA